MVNPPATSGTYLWNYDLVTMVSAGFHFAVKTSLQLILLQPISRWKQGQKLEFTSSRYHHAQLVDIMTSLVLPVFLVLLDALNV